MKKLLTIIILWVLSYYIVFAQIAPIKEYKLDNGLTVILSEDHNLPEVFGLVIVKAGSKNDPADATGLAHYQEHMLFKGTDELGTANWEKEKPLIDSIFHLYDQFGKTKEEKERAKIQEQINVISVRANEYAILNEMSNLIKGIGGTNLNAGTGPDVTMFYNSFPPNQIERWLEIYSHRFINPVFRGFQAELEVVYEEKNLYADMFQFNLLEQFQKQFFKHHPYGQQSMIGSIEHLKNPSLTKMYEFFKIYYVANNMALILCGDFNSDEVMPMIKEKFSRWRSAEIPRPEEYKEEPFNGREFYQARLSPIKLAILGFRTVPQGHSDEIALKVCNGILSNENQTGLLDKLTLDNKLLAAIMIQLPYNDYGAGILFIVPKIIGQKLEDAEKLVMAELEKLGKGDFPDWLVETIKNQLYKQYQLQMESNQNRAIILANNFGQNKSIEEVLSYPEKLHLITKQDVINVANKYYGKNYLAFYSKMGFPRKEKIEKPGYKPTISNTNAKSPFAERLEKIQPKQLVARFVDFNTDIKTTDVTGGVKLYWTENPVNDIFSMTIKLGVGSQKMPLLKYAAEILNYSGTEKYSVTDLKSEFSKIGCSYDISCDDSYVYIETEGIEANLDTALKLLNQLLTQPKLEKNKLNIIIQRERANRKVEKSEPDNVADALIEYVQYKEKSDYIDRLGMDEIKTLNTDSLVKEFIKATQYEAEIHYVGKQDINKVKNIINNTLSFTTNPIKTESPVVLDNEIYKENHVFFTNKKKAVQSKVYFFANGEKFTKDTEPFIDAFNLYFGGDFSGLVMQEIREYRSMAYATGAKYSIPKLTGKNSHFVGYVGTQADKTLEALNIFNDLIKNMPEKPERVEMIKTYLIQSALTARPHFRDLTENVVSWKLKGYNDDPSKLKTDTYQTLTFDDIVKFYKTNIQPKPLVIAIVGNKKRFNPKELTKFGEITKVKEKSLFTK